LKREDPAIANAFSPLMAYKSGWEGGMLLSKKGVAEEGFFSIPFLKPQICTELCCRRQAAFDEPHPAAIIRSKREGFDERTHPLHTSDPKHLTIDRLRPD
jgi:hypothetical protein